MQLFLIFILSISGLSWILVKSPLFKSLREYITRKQIIFSIAVKSTEMRCFKNTLKYKFYWILDSLLNCEGCMGFWAAIVCYLLYKFHVEIILFAFAGTIISLSLIGFINFLNKR